MRGNQHCNPSHELLMSPLTCLSACLSTCSSVYLSTYLPTCLSLLLSTWILLSSMYFDSRLLLLFFPPSESFSNFPSLFPFPSNPKIYLFGLASLLSSTCFPTPRFLSLSYNIPLPVAFPVPVTSPRPVTFFPPSLSSLHLLLFLPLPVSLNAIP